MKRAGLRLSERLVLWLYGAVSAVVPEWLVLVLVKRRARSHPGEESAERARERVARGLPSRPPGRLIWLHSIGPGDSTANLVLLQALREVAPDLHFLVTTRTVDAQKVFRREAEAGGVTLLLAPHDLRRAIGRHLRHWRPDAAVFCEGDLWPNTLAGLKARGAAVALVNGQFNGRLGRLLRRMPGIGHKVMAHVDLLHVFSEACAAEARHWLPAGAELVLAPNLKMDARPLAVKPELREGLIAAWGGAPIVTGASVDSGEIDTLLDALDRARAHVPEMRLILAPRWKEQGAQIHDIARARGHGAPRRSEEGLPGPDDAVFVADSYGELGTWFDLSFAVFMGHTLFGGVGHNPYEPILQRRPVIAGAIPPFLAADYGYLEAAGLCHVAGDAPAIAERMVGLWRAGQAEEASFASFVATQGFSRDLARRILARI